MATTVTSRISLDPPSSLIDLPPHPLSHIHPRVPDLAPAVLSQSRRASSESQAPGRASPSPRITRRTPVPFLLEAFPAPPSHIPGAPASVSPSTLLNNPSLLASAAGLLSSVSPAPGPVASTNAVSPSNSNAMSPCSPKSVAVTLLAHNNPPPSSPPTGPLPPIPGPSSVTPDLFTAHRTLQATARSVSPAHSRTGSWSRPESHPRQSLDGNESVRGRRRQGSLSSLRNPVYSMGEQSPTIVEEPVEQPPPPATSPPLADSKDHDESRASLDSLGPALSSVAAAVSLGSGDKPYLEDSIASVDMSDLSAIKSDEGEGDERASRAFPRCPPLPRSKPESPVDSRPPAPLYVHMPRKPSTSEDLDMRHRAMSPEITQIMSAMPRPRKRSTSSRSRDPSTTRSRKDSAKGADVPPVPTSPLVTKKRSATKLARSSRVVGGDEANDSDSSLDLHTPLPQLMLRHGMLSPNSKLLPQPGVDPARLSIMSGLSSSSYLSNASNISLLSMKSTCSKHPKDARDTPQRRVRHRDGKLLKGGIGLTTGLGWSDSEDEDAPSQLTRRVSTLVLSRRASSSSVASYRSSQSQSLARSISHSILREVDKHDHPRDADDFGYSHCPSAASRSLPSRSKPASRVGSVRSISSSVGRYSTYSASSAPTGLRARAGSGSESSIYAVSIASSNAYSPTDGNTTLMPGIREYDDGVTPTRAAFDRSSVGSVNGASPSSTASSGSFPFPPTPEDGEALPRLQSPCDQDKCLPSLPLAAKSKYPFTQSSALPRPRTYSNASSVSNGPMLGVSPGVAKQRSISPTSTRQLFAERHAKSATPAGSPRPSLGGTPRPSLTIPKSPLPCHSSASALPRPVTPSSSPHPSAGQGYTPRPLKLVSRGSPMSPPTLSPSDSSHPQAELNQSPAKALQPGEQLPRPGQVLTYNRNIHDQLKLRTFSLNTGPNRAQSPAVSPGGTQTLFTSLPGAASGPSSATSTPVTGRSQSPLPSPASGMEGFRPKPRTGTGMVYRTNLSVGTAGTSRIRAPAAVSR